MRYLSFEKSIEVLASRAAQLRETGVASDGDEAAMLEERAQRQLDDLYARLTPWQSAQVARHPQRPHFQDFVEGIFADFVPLCGDRAFGDDQAILGGLARLGTRSLVVIGHAKGLWRSADGAPDAADAMKITAGDLLQLGVIHRIVYEPRGGAHRDHGEMIKRLSLALHAALEELACLGADEVRAERRDFFLALGQL
jgi:acetyl-CoA carboxylase alpha subunit